MTTTPAAATEPTGAAGRFSAAEYHRRWAEVGRAAAELGADAVAVTAKLSVAYLTGTWGSQYWVAPLIFSEGTPPTFLVREFEVDRVRHEGAVDQLATYHDRADAVPRWAETLTDLGLARCRLGLELDNTDLTPRDVADLTTALPGLEIVDISPVLPRVMACKSAEEMAVMRTAAGYTEAALEAFGAAVRVGSTESEIRAAMDEAVRRAGSSGLRGTVAIGTRTALPHTGGGSATVRPGDVAVTEVSGYERGYCAALCRTAVLGSHPEAEQRYAIARAGLEAGMAAMRPGVTAGEVYAAVHARLAESGAAAGFRHRAGYSNGLQANGRLNISLAPGAPDVLEEGMTFHLPIILFEPGAFSVACSESVVVTPQGAEPIGSFPRSVIRIDDARSASR